MVIIIQGNLNCFNGVLKPNQTKWHCEACHFTNLWDLQFIIGSKCHYFRQELLVVVSHWLSMHQSFRTVTSSTKYSQQFSSIRYDDTVAPQ